MYVMLRTALCRTSVFMFTSGDKLLSHSKKKSFFFGRGRRETYNMKAFNLLNSLVKNVAWVGSHIIFIKAEIETA